MYHLSLFLICVLSFICVVRLLSKLVSIPKLSPILYTSLLLLSVGFFVEVRASENLVTYRQLP